MAVMTTTQTTGRIQRWTVAELREALASPDLPEDAEIALRIDWGEDSIRAMHFRLREVMTLGQRTIYLEAI